MTLENEKPKRMRWGLRLLLIVSLALNLMVAGVVGGAVFGHWKHGAPQDRFGSPYVKALSPEDRRAVGREIRSAYRKGGFDRSKDRQSLTRAVALLRAESFEAADLQALMDAQDEAGDARRRVAQAALVARLEAMNTEERRAYADRLEEVAKRGPRGHKDREYKKD